jgi:hypothetical protein
MIRPVKPHPSYWNLFTATAIGFTAIVLFGRPGEFVRPYLIAVKERVSFSSQMAAWVLERIYDLLAVALIFGLGLSRVKTTDAYLSPGMSWVLETGGYIVSLIAAACLGVLLVFRQFSGQLRTRVLQAFSFLPGHLLVKLDGILTAFLDGVKTTRSHTSVLLIVVYTFAEWVLVVLSLLSVVRAFPGTAELDFMEALILLGFIAFGSIIQIPGVGGGMQIATIVVLADIFRMPLEAATGIAIAFWVLNFAIIVPFGLVLAARQGINWKTISHLEVSDPS